MLQQRSEAVLAFWVVGLCAATAPAKEPVPPRPAQVLKHAQRVGDVSISSDGLMVVVAGRTYTDDVCDFILWNAKTGKQIRDLKSYPYAIAGLAFFQNDRYLLTAGYGNTVRVVEVSTGEVVAEIKKFAKLRRVVPFGRTGMLLMNWNNSTEL